MRFCVALVVWGLLLSSQTQALEPDQVYAKVAPSIVVVVGHLSASTDETSYGSGVIIAPGQVITNCHVVEGSDVVYLKGDRYSTIGIIRYADPDRDLCQIGAVDPVGFQKFVARIGSIGELRVGQKVYAIGSPQGFELTLSDGLIASLRRVPDVGTIIQTNAPISGGSSGGGLFDSEGRLIGITSFIFRTGQNLNFAIPATWISNLPERHKASELAKTEKAIKDANEEVAQETKRQAKAAAQQKPVDDWKARIQARINSRVVLPPGTERSSIEARFEVVLLPGGEVLNATLKKPSGNPAYDAAVERAIMAAQPLPVPTDPELFQENFRELNLVFRPRN